MKKCVVVSGASGGIGRATVIDLIRKGYFVIGLDVVDNKFKNPSYRFIKTDLTKASTFKTIKKDVSKICNGEIYALLHLAGIFMMQSMIEGKEEDLRKIIEINFFGVYNLTKALFPLLSTESRVLIFSSEVARYSPQPFDGYYALSKVLVDKYADILRREFNYMHIKVIKVQCGAIKTNLLKGVNNKYDAMVKDTVFYKKPLTKLKHLMDNEISKQVSPRIVSYKLVKIISSKNPKISYKIKNSFKLRFLNALPEKLQDKIYLKVIN